LRGTESLQDSPLEGTGFEPSVPREIGLAECVAVGAAQPIEPAVKGITPAHLDRTDARETEVLRFPVEGSRI
jgi:hypothetical protein